MSKKRGILPMDNEAVFHGERYEVLLPNESSAN